jgi:hypothetical protein
MDMIAAERTVAEVASDLAVSGQTIYNSAATSSQGNA